MNASPISSNPYPVGRADIALAPFAGRQKAFEHIYQQLTRRKSSVILGRRESGKTAVLHHFRGYFDENFISVYASLKDTNLQSEGDWLLALAEATLNMMLERNLSLSKVVVLQPNSSDIRGWFVDTFLREVAKVARSQRLVFLLDDAGVLINAVQEGRLPNDHFTFLCELLKSPTDLGMVLALESQREDEISLMSPLAELTDGFRLENLTEDEAIWLLQKPPEGRYTIPDEAAKAVYRATGGQPRLLQRFGYRLYRLWETSPNSTVLTVEDVKTVMPQVFSQSEADFQRVWEAMNRNERLLLTAITQLHYADPLTVVDDKALERWLVESDYPLDMTAIHVALRGLEYEEIVIQSTSGIRIGVGLLQTWVLENGQLHDKPASPNERRLWWVAVIVLLMLVILLALIGSERSGSAPALNVPPTLTLVTTP